MYVHTSLRPVDGWALVLTSSGSTITKPSSTAWFSSLVHRERRRTPGKAGRYPLGKGLFPLGLGFLRVVEWQVVIDEPWHSVGGDYGGPEQGQLSLKRPVQDRAVSVGVARRSVVSPLGARC